MQFNEAGRRRSGSQFGFPTEGKLNLFWPKSQINAPSPRRCLVGVTGTSVSKYKRKQVDWLACRKHRRAPYRLVPKSSPPKAYRSLAQGKCRESVFVRLAFGSFADRPTDQAGLPTYLDLPYRPSRRGDRRHGRGRPGGRPPVGRVAAGGPEGRRDRRHPRSRKNAAPEFVRGLAR